MVDRGIIPEHWSKRDLGTISKNIGIALYEDCLKEELDTVELIGNEVFRKMCVVPAMPFVKSMLE